MPRLDPVKPDPRNQGATYPRERFPAGTDVPVYLKVVISDQGVVTDVNAISGVEPFATTAIEAAWAWRFSPPTVSGRPGGGFTILRVMVRPEAP
jgi:TonB family protein